MTLRRHAMSYAAIGLVQWLVEYGLMVVLSRWVMPVEPANVIGRLAGAVLGFWLNGKWTFAGEDTHVGRHAARGPPAGDRRPLCTARGATLVIAPGAGDLS